MADRNHRQESGGRSAAETGAAAAAAAAARDEHRARDNRMFGDSSLPERPSASAAAESLPSATASQIDATTATPRHARRQADGQVSAVSIGPASRVSTATLPATIAGNAKQQRKQQQQPKTQSSSDEDVSSGSAANAHLESAPDAMQPLQGDQSVLE